MARVRRNWTPKEDELLRRAVRNAEAQQRPLLWRELAKAVPGRSNKDCRRRWWNSLADGNAKGPWSEEEDEQLIAAVQKHGPNWTQVARDVGSRGSDQCFSHWSHVLDPNINYCDWTKEEDGDLLHEVLTYGTRWAHIASCHTPSRTTLALKNRYSTLRLKNETKTKKKNNSTSLKSQKNREPSCDNTTSNEQLPDQRNSDDEDEEEEDAEEETDEVIEACFGDLGGANKNNHNNNSDSTQHQHSIHTDAGSFKLGGLSIRLPDHEQSPMEWDNWATYGGLPTPQHQTSHTMDGQGLHMSPSEAAAMKLESYLQLDSPMLLSQPPIQQPPISLSNDYFHDPSEKESMANNRTQTQILTPPYALHETSSCQQTSSVSGSPGCVTPTAIDQGFELSQDTGAGGNLSVPIPQPTSSTSSAGVQNIVAPQYNSGWDMGTTGATPSSSFSTPTSWLPQGGTSSSTPPPWTHPSTPPAQSIPPLLLSTTSDGHDIDLSGAGNSSQNEMLSEQPSNKFRITITMTCDQHQLMTVITHLGQYGTNPSINVQKE